MPNTPALVEAGCSGNFKCPTIPRDELKLNEFMSFLILTDEMLFNSVFSVNKHATAEHSQVTKKILESVGICHQIGESQMNAFTGLSGSGPAYVSDHQMVSSSLTILFFLGYFYIFICE